MTANRRRRDLASGGQGVDIGMTRSPNIPRDSSAMTAAPLGTYHDPGAVLAFFHIRRPSRPMRTVDGGDVPRSAAGSSFASEPLPSVTPPSALIVVAPGAGILNGSFTASSGARRSSRAPAVIMVRPRAQRPSSAWGRVAARISPLARMRRSHVFERRNPASGRDEGVPARRGTGVCRCQRQQQTFGRPWPRPHSSRCAAFKPTIFWPAVTQLQQHAPPRPMSAESAFHLLQKSAQVPAFRQKAISALCPTQIKAPERAGSSLV